MRSTSDPSASPGGDYLRVSPWMAPAVALFRRLRFRAKAWLVAATFIVPIAVLATTYGLNQQGTLHDTQAELDGVTYLRAVLPALRQARALRHAAVDGAAASAPAAPPQQAYDDAVAAVRRVDARLGESLDTHDALADLAKAQAAAASGTTPEQVFASRTAVVDALLALTGRVLDTSGLILDPQLETYYLMDASLVAAPNLLERSARLRDRLAGATADGSTSTAGLALGRDEGLAQSLEDELRNDLGKVIGVDAGAKAALEHPAAFTAVDTLRDIATGQGADSGPDRAGRLQAAAAAADTGLEAVQQAALDHLDRLLQERADGVRRATVLTFAMVAACLAAAAYLFRAFSLVMGHGLREVRVHLGAIQAGDLTTRPASRGADESAHLLRVLGDMQGALRGMVAEVRRGADHVAQASEEIAAGAQELSGRTGETAAHVERSASSIEQISATVRQTADHAEAARRIAEGNAATATRGGQVVANMAATMTEIRSSSDRIADILGVIDGIAFQTNILALNAAVEAARAGESGRGFAVVAGEVRALAQRCAEASREIKSLIASSVEKVAAGADIVRTAGTTMDEIVGGSHDVQRLLDEIARGAREQAQGVEEVGRGIADLDRGAQANSALVEQTAAAAASLKDQARTLLAEVERFRMESSTH